MGAAASYVAEILVTGLQATIWVVFACLTLTGLDWIDTTAITQHGNWATLITVVLVGFAYTLGTIVDRVADSVLEKIFKTWFRRLWFKLEESRKKKERENELAKVRFGVMRREETVDKFLDYLRSRIRLARSTTFNLFLITVTASLLLGVRTSPSVQLITAVVTGGLVLTVISGWVYNRITRTYYIYLGFEKEWGNTQPVAQVSEKSETPGS